MTAEQKARSHVGEVVNLWGEAVDFVEELYEQQHGEVDEGTEAAEYFETVAANDALDALARFVRWLEAGLAAIKAERERLKRAEDRIAPRLSWAHDRIRDVLERLGKKSKSVGPFRVSTRVGRERLEVDESVFDLESAPDEIVRVKPEVRELDKAAAKAYLQNDENMPIEGLSIGRGSPSVKVD